MKKKTSLLLAILLLASLIQSCGGNTAADETTPSSETSTDTVSTAAESESETEADDTPEVENMDGAALTILNYTPEAMSWTNTVILVEETTGDILNDALYHREQKVEELYHCLIEENAQSDVVSTITNSVTAGDHDFDLAMLFDANVANVLTADRLSSWNNLDLDLTQPWFDSDATKQYNFYGTQAAISGAYSLYNYSTSHAFLFNNDLKEAHGITDDFYELVRDGKWTVDALYKYAALAVNDLDGDGTMNPKNDCYGATGTVTRFYSALITGADIRYIDRQDDGTLYYALVGNEPAQTYLSKLVSLNNGNDIFTSGTEDIGGSDENIFPAGRALFLADYTGKTENIRDVDFDIGFLPPPKADETQDKYYSLVEGGAQSVLPKTVQPADYHRIETILNAFAYYSYKESIPAYIDVLLMEKVARNAESAEMLELIFDSAAYDLGTGIWSASTKNMFTQNVFLPKEDQISSTIAKTQKLVGKQLEVFTKAVGELK